MKVSPEDVRTRLDAWRGVGACTASCFMASRALSRGARTNGAVSRPVALAAASITGVNIL